MKKNFDRSSKLYSKHYEKTNNRYSIEKQLRLNITIQEILGENDGEPISILDVGCGIGILYENICLHHKKIKYTGIDISKNMIEAAVARNLEAVKNNNANFTVEYNPKNIGAFDYVTSLGVIGYQENQKKFLIAMLSNLKNTNSAKLILTIGNGKSYIRRIRDFIGVKLRKKRDLYTSMPPRDLQEALLDLGFEIKKEFLLLPLDGFSKIVKPICKWKILSQLYMTELIVISKKCCDV